MKTLILLILALPLWAAPAFVQASSGGQAATSLTAVSGTTSTTAGNTLIVFTSYPCNASLVLSMSDTAGDTFQVFYESQNNSYVNCLRGWIASNITANASNVVTFTVDVTGPQRWITVAEVSGVASSTPRDAGCNGNTSNNASATSIACGPFTTLYNDEIVVIGMFSIGVTTTWTAATGYTIPANATTGTTSSFLSLQYKVLSATVSASLPAATNATGSVMATGGISLSNVNITSGSGGNVGVVY